MIKGKHTRIAGGTKFWSENTMMVGGLTSKPTVINQHNFISNPTLPAFLTLSRLSAATRFDNTGNLVDAVIDEPRFDYAWDGANWVNQGLLVEKQSTNLFVDSLNLSAAGVNNTAVWNLESDKYQGYAVRSKNTDWSGMYSPIPNYVANTPYTLSCFAKFDSANNAGGFISIGLEGSSTYNKSVGQTKTTGYTRITNTNSVNGNGILFLRPELGDTSLGANRIYVSAIQVEKSTYASSHIKTSGTRVTRSPDNLQLNLSNYTGSIKITYKRQDTEAVESAWLDLTNAINPIISNNLAVGIWLQNIAVYNRILTAQEKSNV